MRFIGNKELLLPEILKLLDKKGLLKSSLTLYDAFCGSGAVSHGLKSHLRIIAGDSLKWCVTYTSGRINSKKSTFEGLGFDPFEALNNSRETKKGFFYKNYSPGSSPRMYLSAENAGRVDFFRSKIETWKVNNLISEGEYHFLLASLIESISAVSNTAGVYGAFLKKWDSRALKPIKLAAVGSTKESVQGFKYVSGNAEDLAKEIKCDIIYLDPPYTQNQYGTQYHIFETLVLQDKPKLSAVTGSRPVTPMKSDWSKNFKAHIAFDKTIATTKAKHIIMSYNSEGIMSKEFILASLRRYCKEGSVECIQIPFRKYRNFKSKSTGDLFEYIFYGEKKEPATVVYSSPLNYVGNKSHIISEIRKLLPAEFTAVIDLFGGGFNVGANIPAKSLTYNDSNTYVKNLIQSMRDQDTYEYLMHLQKIIKKYNLQPGNKDSYLKARKAYNSVPMGSRDVRLLFAVIMHGYQQQIRFNANHEFNNPPGLRWVNDSVLEKFISFSRHVKSLKVTFESSDFRSLEAPLSKGALVYMDPPYRLTLGAYNDGKRGFRGWSLEDERALRRFADELNDSNRKFMISYVFSHAGKENSEFRDWCKARGYNVFEIDSPPRARPRKEVVITNYGHRK